MPLFALKPLFWVKYFVILSFLNFIHMLLLLEPPTNNPAVPNVAENFLRRSLVSEAEEGCRRSGRMWLHLSRAIWWHWASRRNEVCLHHLVASANPAKGIFCFQHASPTSLNSKNTDEAFAISGNSKRAQRKSKVTSRNKMRTFSVLPPHTWILFTLPPFKAQKSRLLKE